MNTFCFRFLLFSLLLHSSIFASQVQIRVHIKNGTTGQTGSAESAKLIMLQQAMVPLEELKNVNGTFSFSPQDVPDNNPLLIQLEYKGAHYNQMVPPVPALRARLNEITVYESTANKQFIKNKSVMQMTKTKESIEIFKVFLLQNNTIPPKSYYNPANLISLFIPENAQNVFAQLSQGNSKMAIPIQLVSKGQGVREMDRALLPGTSELQVSYSIPLSGDSVALEDRLLFEKDTSERAIFVKPKDTSVEILGAKQLEEIKKDIPEGIRAWRVVFSPPAYKVQINLSGGTIQPRTQGVQTPREVVNGRLFPNTERSILGGIAILGLLFTLSFVFVYRKF